MVENVINRYDAFIFELDNVLYPEKDYLLQVYYLFSQFMEYTVQINAAEMLTFMKAEYEAHGADAIFDKTKAHFFLEEQYRVNFNLLNSNAKLPLKLLLFPEVALFLKNITEKGKKIFLLTTGNPEKQLNKVRQIEWEGLAEQIKVYFADEIAQISSLKPLNFLSQEHDLQPDKVLYIGKDIADENMAAAAGVNFLKTEELSLT